MSDIAFKVLIGNGYDDVIFKTIMLKGEKGDTGETDIDDSTISASKTWSSQKINSMIVQTGTIEDVEIASFSDGADDVPVSELIVDITAVQAGSGVPSPDNVRAISGFDNGVVTVTSKNVFDMDSWLTSIKREHTVIGNVITISYLTLPVYDNPCVISNTDKPFFLSVNEIGGNATGVKLQLIDSSNNVVAQVTNASRTASGIGCKIRIDYGNGGSAIFNNPIVSEHYNTYTFAFGQTVYGGHFDNKGNELVTHTEIELSTLSWLATTLGSQDVWRTRLPTGVKGYADNFVPTNILCENYKPNSVDNMYSGYSGISLRASGNYIYCSRTDLNEPQGKLIAELITPRATAEGEGNLVVTYSIVDLGSLNWSYESGEHSRFVANVSGIKRPASSTTASNILCSALMPDLLQNIYIHANNYAIGVHSTHEQIWVYDNDYTDATAFKTAMNGVKLVYELANPITLPVTAQNVATLLEINNIFANTGKINKLIYFKKGSEAIARMIEAYMRASN